MLFLSESDLTFECRTIDARIDFNKLLLSWATRGLGLNSQKLTLNLSKT